MKVKFQRDLNHNYLVLEKEDILETDYQVKMITVNDIKGLLKCTIQKVNNQIQFFYEISSKQPMKQIYEKKN